MLENLFKILIIVLFSSFPLLLWGYGTTFLSSHGWDRARFWSGIAGGTIAVIAISLFQRYLQDIGSYEIGAIIAIFTLLAGIVWGITSLGSAFIRGFLRKTVLLHVGLFSLCLVIYEVVRENFSIPSDILPIVA